jgi:hypothetical protein
MATNTPPLHAARAHLCARREALAAGRRRGGGRPGGAAEVMAGCLWRVGATTLVAVMASSSEAASITCRDNRGQGGAFRMLQPDDMDLVMHGAGQDPVSFRAYWNFMPNDTKPMIFMTYTGLNASSEAAVDEYMAGVEKECASYGDDHYVMPQIGLSMSDHGKGYDAAVAAGEMDEQIGWLARALQNTLRRPAYVRIGYEFNGAWNGYSPKTYVRAFERVAKAIRAGKTVATVCEYGSHAPHTHTRK